MGDSPGRGTSPDHRRGDRLRAIKLILRPLVLVLLSGALLAPAAAQAATVSLSSLVFPAGTAVPGGMKGTVHVSGGKDTLFAPAFVYQPPPKGSAAGTPGTVYEFMFWNINGSFKGRAKA